MSSLSKKFGDEKLLERRGYCILNLISLCAETQDKARRHKNRNKTQNKQNIGISDSTVNNKIMKKKPERYNKKQKLPTSTKETAQKYLKKCN